MKSTEVMLCELLEELGVPYDPDDLGEWFLLFCKYRKLLQVILHLCE